MQTIFKLASNLANVREKQRESRPYHINLLEQLRCNENSHTRILMELLRYAKKGKYPFTESFISLMCSINGLNTNLPVINPKISCMKDYIDGLIIDNNYSVIIENKVCNAVDRNAQIDTYVNTVRKKNKTNFENIFVIYLTSDGTKEVKEYSYSQKTQKLIGNHFIKMNYKDHIIPWLNSLDVKGEPEIENCIELYINYLEGWFDMNKNDKAEYEEAKNEILTGLEVRGKSDGKKLSALISLQEKLDDLKETVEQSRIEYADKLLDTLKTVFNDIGKTCKLQSVGFPEEGEELLSKYSGFGFYKAEWKKCIIRFEFDDDNLKYFFFGIKQKKKDTNTKKLRKALNKIITPTEDEGDAPEWPWWKKTDKYTNWDEGVLHEVMKDSSKLKKYVTEKLKEMLEILKDNELEQFM